MATFPNLTLFSYHYLIYLSFPVFLPYSPPLNLKFQKSKNKQFLNLHPIPILYNFKKNNEIAHPRNCYSLYTSCLSHSQVHRLAKGPSFAIRYNHFNIQVLLNLSMRTNSKNYAILSVLILIFLKLESKLLLEP